MNLKANQSTTYTKIDVDALIANIPLSSYYTKTQLDTMCSTVFDYCYSQSEADVLLNLKANQSTTYTKVDVDTLIADIPLSSYYTKTQLDTMFSTVFNYCYSQGEADVLLNLKQDILSNASAQTGMKTYPLLLNNTIKQLRFQNPLDVLEELDNRITVQLLNSHITYTSSLTFQDVDNLSLNTLQIKGGSSGIQIIDSNSNSLMDLDNTQISINKPLVCSSTGYFTENVTAPNLYSKTEIDTLIANNPGQQGPPGSTGPEGPQGATGAQGDPGTIDTNDFYTKTETDIELATKQNVTTELTNLLSIFTVGTDTIGVKNPNPSSTVASLDIDNGLIVRSFDNNHDSLKPFIYLCRGNQDGIDRHHRISGSTMSSNYAHLNRNYLLFQICDGLDNTGNTFG